MKNSLRTIAAGALVAMVFAPQSISAHEFGPRTYNFPNDANGTALSCKNAHAQVRGWLRRAARSHCRNNHDSGSNALQRTTYRKGTCTKTKRTGQRASYNVSGATFTATCR